ncbi:MAG TPA: hypothetical protein V6C81_18475 [Planktothrix sp.]|jgi:hypothetical protein
MEVFAVLLGTSITLTVFFYSAMLFLPHLQSPFQDFFLFFAIVGGVKIGIVGAAFSSVVLFDQVADPRLALVVIVVAAGTVLPVALYLTTTLLAVACGILVVACALCFSLLLIPFEATFQILRLLDWALRIKRVQRTTLFGRYLSQRRSFRAR